MRSFVSFLATATLIGCASSPQHPITSQSRGATSEVLSVTDSESGESHGIRVVVTPMQNPEEGVYFFSNGYSTVILELRDGRYRYWFWSDVLSNEAPKHPLTGRYTSTGSTVRLEHTQRHMQDSWTFRKLNEETTLWRPAAITSWRDKRAFDYFGILYPTNLKPEDIWQKGVRKVGP